MNIDDSCYSRIDSKSMPSQALKLLFSIFLMGVLFTIFTIPAHADFGPKPSVTITITNPPESICYSTLLSSTESNGPHHAVSESDMRYKGETLKAFSAFSEYAAQDDFFYWGEVYEIKDGSFRWGYYPPDHFKILLYDTTSSVVYASAETERYAFDSSFKVTILEDGTLSVSKESHLLKGGFDSAVRLTATLLIEILIALLFGYRAKKELVIILVVNIITQTILNAILAVSDYYSGPMTWQYLFPLLELAIFICESKLYSFFLKSHTKKRAVLYAITANAASLILGVLVSVVLM